MLQNEPVRVLMVQCIIELKFCIPNSNWTTYCLHAGHLLLNPHPICKRTRVSRVNSFRVKGFPTTPSSNSKDQFEPRISLERCIVNTAENLHTHMRINRDNYARDNNDQLTTWFTENLGMVNGRSFPEIVI